MGPGLAPALSGPTRSSPLASTRAMLPPPEPMVWMSTSERCSGTEYARSFSLVTAGLPSRMRVRSKLVPPMSQASTLSNPASWLSRAAAIAPAAGPDSTVCAAARLAVRVDIIPPLPCISRSSRPKPASASRRSVAPM